MKIEVLAGTKQMVDLFVVAIVLLVRIYVFDINVDEGEYKVLAAKHFFPLAEVHYFLAAPLALYEARGHDWKNE